MEKLKIGLAVVVLLLAAAVVYGYVDDGSGEEPAATDATVTEAPSQAPPPATDAPDPAPDPDPGPAPEPKIGAGPLTGKGDSALGGAKAGGDSRAGGGSSAANAGAPAADDGPSAAAFAKRADKICARMPARFAARAKRLRAQLGETPAQPEVTLRKAGAPTVREAARRIGKLAPPAGREGEAEAMVAALEKVAREIGTSPASALGSENPALADFARLAKRFGLENCGQF